MSPIDNDLVEAVLKHADIVNVISSYLQLTKKGKDYLAICPFHDDTNPSMHVSPDKQIFKCFVCGTGGSAISFVQKYEHISFFEAMVKVAELSNYDDPRLKKNVYVKPVDKSKETLLNCLRDLTTYYQYALNTNEGKEGLDYFEERHLDASLRSKYQLGYAFKDGKATCQYLTQKGHSLKTIEDIGIATASGANPSDRNAGRVIFPICDADGNVVGFSARRLGDGDSAKYINSPETKLFHKSSILYNYHIAKDKARIANYIYVVEGFMDVYALSRIGIDSAVALMGTALTQEHIAMLRMLNVEVRLCLDGDNPGQSRSMAAANELSKAGISFRVVDNQGSSKDPDEILNEEGPERLRFYLSNLISRIDFALNYYQRTNPLKTTEEKKQLIRSFMPILANIKSQLEIDSYTRKLAQITGFDIESIKDLLRRYKNSGEKEQTVEEVMSDFHPERKALRKLEIAEREILYQMLNHADAVAFYEKNIKSFYDESYRKIARYIVEYCEANSDQIDTLGLISMLEMNDVENKDELIREITDLSLERTHPKKDNPKDLQKLLENLYDSITEEKENIYSKDILDESLKGKSDLEKARILANYNKNKVKREEARKKAQENDIKED